MSVSRILLPRKKIFYANGQLTATFTAAVTGVVTANAHGLINGCRVELTTTDTLPGGLSTGVRYYVVEKTTNTFKLSLQENGPAINITSTGTGTHTFTEQPDGEVINVASFQHLGLSLATTNSGNMTVKAYGSRQDTPPDFNAAQSPTNHYTFVNLVDNNDRGSITDSAPIAPAGTDIVKDYAINVDHFRFFTLKITAHTAGEIYAWASGVSNQ